MPIPQAVLEQEKEAERLYNEAYQQPQESITDQSQKTDEQSASPETGSQEQPQVAQPAEDSWEHRYKVITGKYNAEVPKLAADNRELRLQLKQMQNELEQMKQAKPPERLVTEQEIEEYGPVLDVARKIAKEELTAKDREIEALKGQIDRIVAKTDKVEEIGFFERMTQLVPNWMSLNEDKKFHEWLDGFDEFTGRRRQSLLEEAQEGRDAVRCAKFFTAFEKASQTWAAAATQSLASQVVPETNRATTPPPGKKIWTTQEIDQFYRDWRGGRIKDKQAVAIEADIQMAMVEGRIR